MSVDGFPIPFPITDWVSVDAGDVVRRQGGAGVTGAGRDFVIDKGQPVWKFTFKTRKLTLAESLAVLAFKRKLRGAARFCTIVDPRSQYPQAYMPKGPGALVRATLGTAFDGHASLGAIANSGLPGSIGRDVITLGAPYALPTGLPLIYGDLVELRQGVTLLAAPTDFSTGWTTTNCSLAANTVTDPLGTSTAAGFSRTATGNAFIEQNVTFAGPGLRFRLALWLKLGTLTGQVNLILKDGSGGSVTTTPFTVTTSWNRYEIIAPIPVGGAANLQMIVQPANTSGSAGDTLFLWDPRLTRVDTELISLHSVLDSAAQVADGSGNLTVWVEPELPSSLTAGFGGALANVFNPRGKFRIIDLQVPISADRRYRPGQATVTAISTLQ